MTKTVGPWEDYPKQAELTDEQREARANFVSPYNTVDS